MGAIHFKLISVNILHIFSTLAAGGLLVIGFVRNVDILSIGGDSQWEGNGWYKSLAGKFELKLLRGIFSGTFFLICQLKLSHIIGRIWRDRICGKGSIGDTSQKEGNSEFSFLQQKRGSFFTSAVTRGVAMLLPCFLCYPGMLQGYVLLLGNFPSMPIPID